MQIAAQIFYSPLINVYNDKWIIDNNDNTYSLSSIMQNTIHIKSINDSSIFLIQPNSSSQSSRLRVIGVIPRQIITQKRIIPAKIDEIVRISAEPIPRKLPSRN